MSRSRVASVAGIVLLSAATSARAVVTTSVTLAGKDDRLSKPGIPGIALRVEADGPDAIAVVSREIAREFQHQVYTRALHEGDSGDFGLVVAVGKTVGDGSTVVVPFTAELTDSRGERVWRIAGHTEVRDEVVGRSAFIAIARNVISALVHDGWVAPRFDPEDPPPQAPTLRMEAGR